ncbi:hypothetical protein [Granulicella sp. dw_53]|uniref:GNAT family N-acetyltransferase n=1 Tax=Granulicella sp. dw_53 TaxID=2719792 RepID=UPI001BD1BF34|nr:hypothetical protein [Granulicella sp. dw_53]
MKAELYLVDRLSTRVATYEDLDVLVTFVNHGFAEDNYPFRDSDFTHREEIARLLETGCFLLTEVEGKTEIAAAIYVELRDKHRGYLAMLTINPNVHPSVGKKMIRAGEAFCCEHGCRIVEGVVLASKTELTVAYLRCGFQIVREVAYRRSEILVQPSSIFLLEKSLV